MGILQISPEQSNICFCIQEKKAVPLRNIRILEGSHKCYLKLEDKLN